MAEETSTTTVGAEENMKSLKELMEKIVGPSVPPHQLQKVHEALKAMVANKEIGEKKGFSWQFNADDTKAVSKLIKQMKKDGKVQSSAEESEVGEKSPPAKKQKLTKVERAGIEWKIEGLQEAKKTLDTKIKAYKDLLKE